MGMMGIFLVMSNAGFMSSRINEIVKAPRLEHSEFSWSSWLFRGEKLG